MTDETRAEGYPVTIALPEIPDGPVVLTFGDGSRAEFDVLDGHASASNRARAAMLLELGGHLVEDEPAGDEPTDTPPTGSGTKPRTKRGAQ